MLVPSQPAPASLLEWKQIVSTLKQHQNTNQRPFLILKEEFVARSLDKLPVSQRVALTFSLHQTMTYTYTSVILRPKSNVITTSVKEIMLAIVI